MQITSKVIGNIGTSDKQLATGMRVPTTVEKSQDFLLNRVKDYDINIKDVDIKTTMELCDKLYRFEGTCGTAIDIFVDFSITKVRAEPTGKANLDKILDHFNKQVNAGVPSTLRGIQEVNQKIGLDWFVKGNAFPYASWDDVDIPGLKAPAKIPTRIVTLNPCLIEIPKETQMLGNAQIYFKPSVDMYNLLRGDGRSYPGLKELKDMLSGLKNKQDNVMGYKLNPLFIRHLKRKGNDYNAWGIPYLTKTFSTIASYRRLRRLDDATTEGLVNLITIYKVGDKDFPADPSRLLYLRNLLSAPTPTKTLVWAHDLEVETVGPDGKILAFEKKYVEPRQELLRALGVPAVLIDPSISPGSDPWVSIIAMAERLQKFRDSVQIWLEDIYRQIAVNNGYEDIYPSAKWERMNLSNDQSLKNLVMQFYDRGLIDAETALEESNYDYKGVLNRKVSNKKNDKLFKPPALPFGGSPGQKGRPTKGSPQDKTEERQGRTKPAVDQKVQKRPSKPETE
jgi:hypothetical protein